MTKLEAAKIIIEQEGRCYDVQCYECPLYNRDIDCKSDGKVMQSDSTMPDPLAVASAKLFLKEHQGEE